MTVTDVGMATARAAPSVPVIVWRLRLLATSAALVVIAFVQDSGAIAPDTKLDLVENPAGLMHRSVHLWDSVGFFGQLQNQAYGYFFPMGPFFAIGRAIALPPWIVQRGWHATLFVVAFLGVVRLARHLQIGDDWARVVAGLAYALAPRMLTVLGSISSEALPMALAPWVLVPLVAASTAGGVRRGAMRSGVAVLFAGGVNAVATLAMLPLPALWLLTREPGPRRRRLMLWWVAAVALATAWWVVPLLTLGRFSPPFLDWIESASVTTATTSLPETLRGTSHWIPRIIGSSGPVWPAGWLLTTNTACVLATAGLAAAGIIGLARREMPHRLFLVSGLLVGVGLVTMGHVGAGTPPWAGAIQDVMDGPLAPVRNVHKWEPVVRLPLVLGLAHLLAALPRRTSFDIRGRFLGRAAAASMLVLTAAPALVSNVIPPGQYAEIPPYWKQAVHWLNSQPGPGRALLLPGSPFPIYLWGQPADEPMQPLTSREWAVRNAVPLSSAGNIRYLDAIEHRLAVGRGTPGLADYLARGGIRYLVVRNDLDWVRAGAPRPELVHQALVESPGLVRVADFGPGIGGLQEGESSTVDRRIESPMPAVEIYRVDRPTPRALGYSYDDAARVSGGPEAVLQVLDRGITGRAVILDAHGRPEDDELLPVVTDSYRRREVGFGGPVTSVSHTLTRADPYRLDRPVHDYEIGRAAYQTVALPTGVRAVVTSSSGSDADALLNRDVSYHPFSAVDGDPATAWVSSAFTGAVGEWYELQFTDAVDVPSVTVMFGAPKDVGALPTRVHVETDAGEALVGVQPVRTGQELALPPGRTSRLRITVSAVQDSSSGVSAAITELAVPGVSPGRTLVAPSVTGRRTPAVLLDALPGRGSCLTLNGTVQCLPELARASEDGPGLDRTFEMGIAGDLGVSVRLMARPDQDLARLLAPPSGAITAEATSNDSAEPAARPQAAVDGDPRTAWSAGSGDLRPEMRLRWPERREVTGLRFVQDQRLAAALPRVITVTGGDGGSQQVQVDRDGTASLRTLTTGRVTIRFDEWHPFRSFSRATGQEVLLPVGFSEVDLLGAEDVPRGPAASRPLALACSDAPVLHIDGRVVPLRVRGSVGDIVFGRQLEARPCTSADRVIPLAAGNHRLVVPPTAAFAVESVTLAPPDLLVDAVPTAPTVDVTKWGSGDREVLVGEFDSDSILAIPENANPGWRATLRGQRLHPLVLDGWQQGWIVPSGGGRVDLVFVPDRAYRAGLVAGALAALLLAALAFARADAWAGPPAAERRFRSIVVLSAGAVAMFAIAGIGGVVVAVLVALASSRRGLWSGLVAGATAVTAAALAAARPIGGAGTPFAETLAGQLLYAAALAALIVSVAAAAPDTRQAQ